MKPATPLCIDGPTAEQHNSWLAARVSDLEADLKRAREDMERERLARQSADRHVDALMGQLARLRDERVRPEDEVLRAKYDRLLEVTQTFVELHSRVIESSHSTPEKQGAWRLMVAEVRR